MDDEQLKQAWADAGRPGSRGFQAYLSRKGIRVGAARLRAFVSKQAPAQLVRGARRLGGKHAAPGPQSRWQADLLDQTSRDATKNDGFRYAVVVADVFSRKVEAEPTENKTPGEVWEAFRALAARMGGMPRVLMTDVGAEFQGVFERELRERGGQHLELDPRVRNSTAVVDSAIKRLREAIAKELLDTGGESWAAALPRAVEAINDRPTEGLAGMAPDDVIEDDDARFLRTIHQGRDMLQNARAEQKLENELQPGKKFRVLLPKREWARAGQPRYSSEVHTVASAARGVVTDTQGTKYRISWLLPVSTESAEVVVPRALQPGDATRDAERLRQLGPYLEALEVKIANEGPLSLQAAGNYLATIPNYAATIRRLGMLDAGLRAVVPLKPETFVIRGEGPTARIHVRGVERRRVVGKRPPLR